MGIIKQIVIWVIVLVLAMTIFSYFFSPSAEYKISSISSDIKEKVSSTIEKIPSESKTNCKEWAKDMTPKYWLSSNSYEDQEVMHWRDGSIIDYSEYGEITLRSCLRVGSLEGENINYLYYNEKSHGFMGTFGKCSPISYSKKAISESGEVLGTNNFTINPIFKEVTKDSTTYSASFNKVEKILKIKWDGFDDFIKEVFEIETFNLEIYEAEFGGWKKKVICTEDVSEESGLFICDTSDFKKTLYINITPEIFSNNVYEIVDYNITDCRLEETVTIE